MNLSEQITECFNAIDSEPFNKLNYLKLISVLSIDKQLMKDELIQARVSMAQHFYLTANEWLTWLADVQGDLASVKDLFELRIQDNPSSSDVWCQFLDLMRTDPQYEVILQKSIQATNYDILENYKVLQRAIGYFEEKHIDQLKQLLLSFLKIPHSRIDETFNYYSSYISKYESVNYEHEMILAREIYTTTKKLLDFVEFKEVEILNDHQNSEFWVDYLHLKGNKKFKQVPVLLGIFERAIRERDDDDFISVWVTIIDLLYELDAPAKTIKDLLTRFTKRYPYKCISWARYIGDLDYDEEENFFNARERILQTKLLPNKETPYADKKPLLVSIISFLFKSNKLSEYQKDLEFYFNFALRQNDSLNSVERLIIELYDSLGELSQIKKLTTRLINDNYHSGNVDIWQLWFYYVLKYDDLKMIFKSVKECISLAQKVDNPQKLIDEIKRYCALHYDVFTNSKLRKLIERTNESLAQRQVAHKRRFSEDMLDSNDEEDTKVRLDVDNEAEQASSSGKRSRTKDIKTRDREHLTVLVKNLPDDIKSSQLKSFFKGCDPINNINLKKTDSQAEASIEFGTTQAMLALLTKNFKRLGTNEISVEQAFNTTVWVTNFPPQADKVWIEELFSHYGDVISVRLPSLKGNIKRRFCYVEFSSSSAAAESVSQLDGKEVENFKLVVKISNPEGKQQRTNATLEGREVYVCKIDFYKTTEQKIRQVFEKYGDIERINLPLSYKNKKLDRKHDGYGFVTFFRQEDAEECIELDGTNLDGRIIEVSIAQQKPKTRSIIQNESSSTSFNNTKDVIISKTLKLSNLPDTINVHRLQAILEKMAGPVRKIDLNIEYRSAIVEFENVTDAGAAEMKLAGQEIDGNLVEIGTRRGNGEKRKLPVLDAPVMNRRQRRLLEHLLKQPVEDHIPLEVATEKLQHATDSESGTGTGLSNNDFRNMLLSGGSKTK